MGDPSIHHHYCVLRIGQATHKERGILNHLVHRVTSKRGRGGSKGAGGSYPPSPSQDDLRLSKKLQKKSITPFLTGAPPPHKNPGSTPKGGGGGDAPTKKAGGIEKGRYFTPRGVLRYISDGDVRMRRNC